MTIRIVLGCICLLFFAQARAQELRSFQEGGRYGFKKGTEVIIPALYSYASEFSDGAALVKENASWGFLKENGEWLVKPSFDNAQPFHDGFALVLKGGKYGLIDRFGKLVVPMAFNKIVKDWDGFQLFGEKRHIEYIDDRCRYVLTNGKGYDTRNCVDLDCDLIYNLISIGNIHD